MVVLFGQGQTVRQGHFHRVHPEIDKVDDPAAMWAKTHRHLSRFIPGNNFFTYHLHYQQCAAQMGHARY
jgi:hypothetical protein